MVRDRVPVPSRMYGLGICVAMLLCLGVASSCKTTRGDDDDPPGGEWVTMRPQETWTGIVAEPCSLSVTHEGQRFDATTPNGVRVRDITAIAVGPTGDVLLSAGPVQGQPGIYRIDARTCRSRTLVASATKSGAHPYGTDYFELADVVDGGHGVTVDYWYAPEIDRVADVAKHVGLVRRSVRVGK